MQAVLREAVPANRARRRGGAEERRERQRRGGDEDETRDTHGRTLCGRSGGRGMRGRRPRRIIRSRVPARLSSAAKSVSFPANPARRACRGGAEVAGGEAVGLAEGAVEGGQAAEAPGEGDLGYRASRGQRIGERRTGRLEATAQDVAGEALAGALEQ